LDRRGWNGEVWVCRTFFTPSGIVFGGNFGYVETLRRCLAKCVFGPYGLPHSLFRENEAK
jgi:hypothetical protein